MKRLVILIIVIAITGCGTGRSGSSTNGMGGPGIVSGPVFGINSVQDGTIVSLNRIDDTGNVVQVVAETSTSSGHYSFNLSRLGVTFSSNLLLQISDPASGEPVRAFVDSEVVNIHFASESAVRMVLEILAGGTGKSLSNFTPNELSALRGSLELLALLNQDYSLSGIEPTVSKIRQDFQAIPTLVNFLNKASEAGESDIGAGDVGNYFPNQPGNIWRFDESVSSDQNGPNNYTVSNAITGTRNINGIQSDVYLNGDTSSSSYLEAYRNKNSKGMLYVGDKSSQSSFLTPFLPYQEVRFPLRAGDNFIQAAQNGLLQWDVDGDGIPDKADLMSQVSVDGFESINVPAGTFTNAARITTQLTITFQLSRDRSQATYQATEVDWFAPGIGRIKSLGSTQLIHGLSKFSNSAEDDLIGVIVNGQGQGVRRLVSLSNSRVTPGIQVTLTPADVIPYTSITWASGDTNIATIAPLYGSVGIATAISPGRTVLFVLDNGQISDPAFLLVEDSKTVHIGANDVIYSPLTGLLYVSTASDSTTLPGTITAINPLTGQIGQSIYVGDMPSYFLDSGKLALSKDGRYLYVGLNHGTKGGGLRMVDLVNWTVGAEFPVGSGSNCDPLYPGDFRVLPDNPNAIAVSIVWNCSPSFYDVAIFDNGVPRSNKIQGPLSLQFSDDPTILYGFNSGTIFQMAVDSNGIQITNAITGIIPPLSTPDFKIDSGNLYFPANFVLNPKTWTLIGSYPDIPAGNLLIQPDSSVNRTFFFVGNYGGCNQYYSTCQILVFDQQNYSLIDSITVNLSQSTPPGTNSGTKLIRWGTDGLAMVATGSQLIVLRSPLIAGQ